MCWFLELLAFELYCPLGFYCAWEENLAFSLKLRANMNFTRVSFKFFIVWAFWVLIDSCFSMNACSVSSRFLQWRQKLDTIKWLMYSSKCMSVKVINNPEKSGSIHLDVNYTKTTNNKRKELKKTLRCNIKIKIKQI
jgi:hypothetical protein